MQLRLPVCAMRSKFLPAAVLAISVAAICSGCGGGSSASPPPQSTPPSTPPSQPSTPQSNVIVQENQKPGDKGWRLSNPTPIGQHNIEGYASATSINRGESISFFVSTAAPSYTIDIYRMGWYNGDGARHMMDTITRTGSQQPIPAPDSFGMIECNWNDPYVLKVPNSSDPTDWASGVYLAKLTEVGDSNHDSYIVFVVRDDSRKTDFLFQTSSNTYEAYNDWGGESLYSTPRAFKVSYNRPYGNDLGSGNFFRWEFNLLRFLEREGYDVSYSTDVDTHANANLLTQHKGVLVAGHDEYWSKEMFDSLQAARDAGVNLGFFGADTGYWQVRMEPSPVTSAANRTIVCYKGDAVRLDPDAADPSTAQLTTGAFRDPPVNRPEAALVGVAATLSDPYGVGDLVIADASSPVFQGTGLNNGDKLTGLLGHEVDQTQSSSPSNLTILTKSPYSDPKDVNGGGNSEMTEYTAPSGANVLATGSLQWSWGLDDDNYISRHALLTNPAAQQAMRNILAQFGGKH